ncbi:MAG: M20/M25/M40 family metallo-hydrolase, partial [Pseudomonadota bacterium]
LQEMEETLFPALAEKRTAMPVVPEGAKQSTLNINSLHGGQEELPPDFTGFPAPVVPDSARMIIDRRFLIEEDLDEVKDEFVHMLERVRRRRPGFDYELRDLHEVIPTMTERDAPVVQAVARGIGAVLGKDPDYVVSPGTYDQKHIDRIGRMKNCIAYGPGILDLAHQPDEWVGIGDMVQAAQVMGAALVDLLTGHGRQ